MSTTPRGTAQVPIKTCSHRYHWCLTSPCHNDMTLRRYVILQYTMIKFTIHRSFFPKHSGRIHRCPTNTNNTLLQWLDFFVPQSLLSRSHVIRFPIASGNLKNYAHIMEFLKFRKSRHGKGREKKHGNENFGCYPTHYLMWQHLLCSGKISLIRVDLNSLLLYSKSTKVCPGHIKRKEKLYFIGQSWNFCPCGKVGTLLCLST